MKITTLLIISVFLSLSFMVFSQSEPSATAQAGTNPEATYEWRRMVIGEIPTERFFEEEAFALAKNESPEAQAMLGYLYRYGKGVEEDLQKARDYFKKAADEGNAFGQYNLGYFYEKGEAVKKDEIEALFWYRSSAQQGDINGIRRMGYMYYYGIGVEKDYKTALSWFEKSAAMGGTWDSYMIGYIYEHGLGLSVDYKEAMEWYEKAAALNHRSSQYELGEMYRNGQGIEVNLEKAVDWHTLSAEQYNINSQVILGNLYNNGFSREDKIIDNPALYWYSRAADLGSISAQYTLGRVVYFQRNRWTASYWLRKAAAQGNEEAVELLQNRFSAESEIPEIETILPGPDYLEQVGDKIDPTVAWRIEMDGLHNPSSEFKRLSSQTSPEAKTKLAYLYLHGMGVEKDYEKTVALLKEADDVENTLSVATGTTETGNAFAQYIMGYMYEKGLGTVMDFGQAASRYKIAADNGDIFAQIALANMHMEGKGIPYDKVMAADWYKMAAENGHSCSMERLADIYANELQDLQEAKNYYEKACATGDGCGTACDKLEGLMYRIKLSLMATYSNSTDLGWKYLMDLSGGVKVYINNNLINHEYFLADKEKDKKQVLVKFHYTENKSHYEGSYNILVLGYEFSCKANTHTVKYARYYLDEKEVYSEEVGVRPEKIDTEPLLQLHEDMCN